VALDERELEEALGVARQVVGEAAALLRAGHEHGQRVEPVEFKSTIRDPVTAWDTRIEDLMRERLTRLSPGVLILGEERGAGTGSLSETGTGSRSELRWLIDPIDGTVNFSHGLPLFGITASLEEAGRPVVAVVVAPALGWEVWARRGGGAFADGRRLAVSRVAELERAILATGFPYDRATSHKNFAEWEHFQITAGACRRFGAASLDLAMVARGWLDGYWESDIEAWDLSGGALLVEEAGGRVTDVTGGPFVSDTGRALATNGAIHRVMLEQLAVVRARGAGA
jgi:myo-inositol-1(or 4)-monophosphatase